MPVHLLTSRGVPGTAGPVVTEGARRYVLANHHVVFGAGGGVGDHVYARRDVDLGEPQERVLVGQVVRGQLGRVTFRDELVFVDCALVELVADLPDWVCDELGPARTIASASAGTIVTKHGAATGTTEGLVVNAHFDDVHHLADRIAPAPAQLLVSSLDERLNFSAPGDSGAALIDERDRVVGLVWGCNYSGQGIACPIEPVLDCLGVTLEG